MAGSGGAHLRRDNDSVLRVENLTVEFPIGTSGAKVHAVSDVSLDLLSGETLGVVGESGCGKSTTGKAIMRVPPPTSGRVMLEGTDLASLDSSQLRESRGRLQMIFQDPISSLNPRRTIRDIVAEPLVINWLDSFPRPAVSRIWEQVANVLVKWGRDRRVMQLMKVAIGILFLGFLLFVVSTAASDPGELGQRDGGAGADLGRLVMIVGLALAAPVVAAAVVGAAIWAALVVLMPIFNLPRALKIRRARPAFEAEVDEKVAAALEEVGIPPEVSMPKRPHEFSGGQAQRISIARALILSPDVIICDEPVSALDVSVQAQVLNLLEDLKASHDLSLIFIAHDLAVVKNVSDRVQVMYLGKTCEVANPDALYRAPRHPYTRALMSAIPVADPRIDPRQAFNLEGELPSPIAPPSGCRFRTRCDRATEECTEREPVLQLLDDGHYVACHHPLDGDDGGTLVSVAGSSAGHNGSSAGNGSGTGPQIVLEEDR